MDAAAGNDADIRALADMEIVINDLLNAILRNQRGDMHILMLRKGLYINIQTRAVGLGYNINIFRGLPAFALAVIADIEGAGGRHDAGNLRQQIFYNITQHYLSPP